MPAGQTRATRIDRETLADAARALSDPKLRESNASPSYLHANPLVPWLFWKRLDVVAGLLQAGTARYDCGVDFGCGLGVLLPTLSGMTRQVYATDLLLGPARRLTSMLHLENVAFIEPDALPASLPPLDYVVSTDVLEHVEDLDATLHVLGDALKPGGKLVISGPTENALYKIGRVLVGFGGKGDYHLTNIHHIHDRVCDASMGFRMDARRVLPLPGIVEAFYIYAYTRVRATTTRHS